MQVAAAHEGDHSEKRRLSTQRRYAGQQAKYIAGDIDPHAPALDSTDPVHRGSNEPISTSSPGWPGRRGLTAGSPPVIKEELWL